MNQRIKKLWIKALRSGKWKQGRAWLRIDGTRDGEPEFCCLGVLCDLHSRATDTAWKGRYYDQASATLPISVQQWAGIDDADPILAPRLRTRASTFNDNGKTFEFIADRIEKYL